LERVAEQGVHDVLIDVAALDVLDSFAARTLEDFADMARLRGARTVVVGISPDVAMALVRLSASMPPVMTALDLGDGLSALPR
jgi:rsbT antagonist protein RsbS